MTASPEAPTTSIDTTIRELWRIAWPIIASSLVTIVVSTNDSMLLAGESARVLASVVASSSILFVGVMFVSGLGVLAQVLLARAVGAGRPRQGREYTEAALACVVWVAMPVAAVVALASPQLVRIVGGSAIDEEFAAFYLRLTCVGVPITAVSAVLRGRASGLGRTRIVLVASLVGAVADVVVSLVLRSVIGPVGVGVGTVLGMTATCLVFVVGSRMPADAQVRPTSAESVPPPRWSALCARPTKTHAEILRLGWPEGVLSAASAGAGVVVTYLLSTAPPTELAASRFLEIATSSIVWTLLFGFGVATTTVLARSLGRGDAGAVRATVRSAVIVTQGIALVTTVLLPWAVPPAVQMLAGAEVADSARNAVVLAASQGVLMAACVVINAYLRAHKDTRGPMMASLIAEYLVFLPVGLWLTRCLEWGLVGVFVAHLVFWVATITVGGVRAVLLARRDDP